MALWRFLFEGLTLLLVLRQAAAECPSLEKCTLECRYGLQLDQNECNICACLEPCQNYDCGKFEVCEVQFEPCVRAPCRPMATCVKPPGTTVSPVDDCLLEPSAGQCTMNFTRWFFNVSALQCQPFTYKGCDGNENRFETKEACLLRCLSSSVGCDYVSCASPCQVQDDNTKRCPICVCPGTTCRDVLCLENEQCQMIEGQCAVRSESCHPRPQCMPITGASPTPMPCPYIDCELMSCPHGFNRDENGCKKCDCYDPCKTFVCPANQICVVGSNDCVEGEECRDAPPRYCIDPTTTQPAITREQQSSENLQKCCEAGGIMPDCMSLCVSNLTIDSSNTNVLFKCPGALNTYLKCAGSGQQFTTCCQKRRVGPSCYKFCAGGEEDMSNPHAFSQCIYSDDLNSVLSCYQQGIPDSTTSVSTTSSTTMPVAEPLMICSLSPESGSCRAFIERWYYEPQNKTCQTFIYGGCQGNGNNFLTADHCRAACQPKTQQCAVVMCDTNCVIVKDANGCDTCECTPVPTKISGSTTQWPLSTLSGCCKNSGVSPNCMQFCSFNWTVTNENIMALLECEPFLNTGLQCARQEQTFTSCCQEAGVTGDCLNACGNKNGVSDYGCLITNHTAMLKCFELGTPDKPCPKVQCSTQCQYRQFKKDAQGCDTCECFDPCEAVTCEPTQSCTYKESNKCEGDMCDIVYEGVCQDRPPTCPRIGCAVSCSYGSVKDSQGCETCECSEPCKGVTCEIGFSCKVMTGQKCHGESTNCETIYAGICSVDCKPINCSKNCTYGLSTDAKGCDVCQCVDPCMNIKCPAGQECRPQNLPTLIGAEGAIKQTFIPQCLTKNATAICTDAKCTNDCLYGHEKNKDGCEICQCHDPCKNITCDSTSVCHPQKVNITSVQVQGQCVRCTGVLCDNDCKYGNVMLSAGCPLCECYDPCKDVQCDSHSFCEAQRVNSTSDHLNLFQGQCVRCAGNSTCNNECNYGYVTLNANCSRCECFDPCKDVKCGLEEMCIAKPIVSESTTSLQRYKGECAPDCKQLRLCDIFCPYGLARSSIGCEICECYRPCEGVACDYGTTCQVVAADITATNHYSFKGECTDCSRSPICDESCEYGYKINETGCAVCECYNPCENITCNGSSICKPKVVEVGSATMKRTYQGVCEVMPCPGVMCANECPFGYKTNEFDCDTCECHYDPCIAATCPLGFACTARVNKNCGGKKSCAPNSVCSPPEKACARQQEADQKSFENNLQDTPQLNCDNAGNYKPLQCYDSLCRCSTLDGMTKDNLAELTLEEAKELCYPNDKIVGVIKMHADINVIQPGQGTYFKQNMSAEIANLLELSDSSVTIIEYKSGSIIIDFIITSVNYELILQTLDKLEFLQTDDVHVKYLGNSYEADIQYFARISASALPPTTSKPGGLDRQTLLIVILVPIFGTILLILLAVGLYFACKMWKGDNSLLTPEKNPRNSVSFDSILEKGSKAGFENQAYDSAKVIPTSGSFVGGSTIA